MELFFWGMFFISGNNVVEKNAMAFANLEALADEEASDGAKEIIVSVARDTEYTDIEDYRIVCVYQIQETIDCVKGGTLSCTVGDEDKILVDSWVEDKDPTQITSI